MNKIIYDIRIFNVLLASALFMILYSNTEADNFLVPPLEYTQNMKNKDTWSHTCPVRHERLQIVKISYYDFSGKIHHDGEIMVLDAVAPNVHAIFDILYQKKFPLRQVKLIDAYNGNDEASMSANNTSAFNNCLVTGDNSRPSLHSYGVAIDINPVQNPFVEIDSHTGTAKFHPLAGAQYANRAENRPGKEQRAGLAENIRTVFMQHGFTIWGGDWDSPIDYQHFQIPRPLAELLSVMESQDASILFQSHVNYFNCHHKELVDMLKTKTGIDNLAILYQKDNLSFIRLQKSLSSETAEKCNINQTTV